MHAGGRRKGKGRSRILYWFRTPPGVRVGRAALDEDAIRLLEQFNPDVEFDWTRILKGQGAEARPIPPTERDYRAERIARRQARAASKSESSETSESSELPDKSELPEPPETTEYTETAELAGSAISDYSDISGYSDFSGYSDGSDTPQPRASLDRLGPEGLARLRARYAEVLARITERVADPARQDELKTHAERLNPDNWVTDAEVTAGLEAYESVFEALRSAVGGPSRRRRRRGRKGGVQPSGTPAETAATDAQGGAGEDRTADDETDEDL